MLNVVPRAAMTRTLLVFALTLAVAAAGAQFARAGAFDCMGALSDRRVSAIMGVPSEVTSGGGGLDDCGINARGYAHIIVTAYEPPKSFFDRLRRTTRPGRRATEGVVVEYTQRTLSGFGGPAFALQTRTFYEEQRPAVVRSVFVYRNGRMLRPTTTSGIPSKKVASIAQLVAIARLANRGL